MEFCNKKKITLYIKYYAAFRYQFHNSTSKSHACPKSEFRKILSEKARIFEQQNNKQKQLILKAQHIRNIQPKLNKINFEFRDNVL